MVFLSSFYQGGHQSCFPCQFPPQNQYVCMYLSIVYPRAKLSNQCSPSFFVKAKTPTNKIIPETKQQTTNVHRKMRSGDCRYVAKRQTAKWQTSNAEKLCKVGCVRMLHQQVAWACGALMDLSKTLTRQVANR